MFALSGREAADVIPTILAADERLERRLPQIRSQVAGRLPRGSRCEHAAARRPRLAGQGSHVLAPSDRHPIGSKPGLLADRLEGGGEDALAHFRVAGADVEPSTFQDADDDVTRIVHAVAEPCALDAAADADIP